MNLGFETVGNATLIIHDKKPILATDPWITPNAYFGSWSCSHQIPEQQMDSILNSQYVWFSHGHPDHLNYDSLPKLKGKKILLPDHLGGRIAKSLRSDGFEVTVLKDRHWYPLSKNVRVFCWADHYQDAILLVEVGDNLLINCNDAVDFGRNFFIKNLAKKYRHSFILSISSIGIADMMNYYDEEGRFIVPKNYLERPPSGIENAEKADRFGAEYFVPSSSFHFFQRTDSAWANEFSRPIEELYKGYESKSSRILPAFISFDLERHDYRLLNPKPLELILKDPKQFGDDWSEPLQSDEVPLVTQYFKKVEHLGSFLDFINIKVGGVDHRIEWKNKHCHRGITLEVPRASLMTAVRHEVFEDLLIGNFMKATLHGSWFPQDLSPEFSVYVGKYSDNGLAHKEKEVREYLAIYRKRFIEFKSYYWLPKLRFALGGIVRKLPCLKKSTGLPA